MKKILTAYQHAVKNLREKQKKEREKLRLHENLFAIAEEYAEKFSSNHEWSEKSRRSYIYYDDFVWNLVQLNLVLAAEDKANCVNPIIDAMIQDPRLDLYTTPNKTLIDTTTATWEFRPKGSNNYRPQLDVRVSYERSESCKLVGTGKFTETKEIQVMVCD